MSVSSPPVSESGNSEYRGGVSYQCPVHGVVRVSYPSGAGIWGGWGLSKPQTLSGELWSGPGDTRIHTRGSVSRRR